MRYFVDPQPSKTVLGTGLRAVVRLAWHVRDRDEPIPFARSRYKSAACSCDELTARSICDMLNGLTVGREFGPEHLSCMAARDVLASGNRKLLDSVATLSRERDGYQTQFMNAGMTVDRLRRDLDEANAALERHKTVADSCRRAAEEFERKYNAARGAVNSETVSARQDRDIFKAKYDEMMLTAAHAQTELAFANKDISALTMDRELLRSERNRLRSQAEAAEARANIDAATSAARAMENKGREPEARASTSDGLAYRLGEVERSVAVLHKWRNAKL